MFDSPAEDKLLSSELVKDNQYTGVGNIKIQENTSDFYLRWAWI